MDKKLIKEAFVEIAGKIAEPLVDILDEKKYMNEFLVAKKLDLPINQTRNILYRISEHGLVSSTRKKDKKKGWYTYSWKVEGLKSLEFLKGMLNKRISQIGNQVKNRESREFYVCERCHVEFNEENALLHDFTCPECGSVLTLKDNTKLLKEMKKNLDNFKGMMDVVDEEIGKGQAAEAKKIRVKEAAEKREKEKKRAEAREARRKAKEKLAAEENKTFKKKTSAVKAKASGTKSKPKKSGTAKPKSVAKSKTAKAKTAKATARKSTDSKKSSAKKSSAVKTKATAKSKSSKRSSK